ncbi:MAG: GPP34 family phosphoprotein [Candidatus Aminicenantes bacterium]|nr:MAG: GPP34 family phosphoprotein [Candidatus Aminicenantes bacterium]
MAVELRLSEELFLLALNEKKGCVAPFKREYFKYGVAAAILQELIILEKLQLDEEAIKVLEGNLFGDMLLDPALEVLGQSQKQKKVQHWVAKLGTKYKTFKNILLNDLMDKGILKRRGEPGTGEDEPKLFRKQRFCIWYDVPLQHLRRRLHHILVQGQEPDPKSLRLIGLIHGCKLTRQVFPQQEDQERVMLRMDTLAEADVFKKAIRNTVNANRAAAVSGIFSAAAMILKEAC